MAQVPTKEEIENIQAKSHIAIGKKIIEQQKISKTFIPHNGGVIPEDIWNNMKVKS